MSKLLESASKRNERNELTSKVKKEKGVQREPRKNWGKPVAKPSVSWTEKGEKVIKTVYYIAKPDHTVTITEKKIRRKNGTVETYIKQDTLYKTPVGNDEGCLYSTNWCLLAL